MTKTLQALNVASNLAQLAFTAYMAGATFSNGDQRQEELEGRMKMGEDFYATMFAAHALGLLGGLALAVVEGLADKASLALDASPVQSPNIEVNAAGIKLQAGANYVEITDNKISLNGTRINFNGPTSSLPVPVPSSIGPTNMQLLTDRMMEAMTSV